MTAKAVERARRLIGTRFRPQGRDPRHGLDCVGLVLAAHDLPADAVPTGYAMRGEARRKVEASVAGEFRRVARTQARDGDLLLLQASVGVLHLGISSAGGVIHADVRHGVVERPALLAWPLVAVFRRRQRRRKG